MHTGKGQIVELILENGLRHARISCPVNLIPSPGQYLLAGIASQSDPLPVSLFSTESTPQGFIASAPIPETWTPGTEINLRGPLGHGFVLPPAAGKIALIAFDDSSARLRGLIRPTLDRSGSVVLVCDTEEENLPDDVEVQPLSTLEDVLIWTEYAAFDVARENLDRFRESLNELGHLSRKLEAQVMVRTPVPCGGVAECGVCAVTLKSSSKLACKDGPVFDLREII